MAGIQLPDDFKRSCQTFESYPRNLVSRASFFGTLQAYRTRLDSAAPKLFIIRETEALVPFRDWSGQGKCFPHYLSIDFSSLAKGFERQNIYDDAALRDWLGDTSSVDPTSGEIVGEFATRRDPKCRFM